MRVSSICGVFQQRVKHVNAVNPFYPVRSQSLMSNYCRLYSVALRRATYGKNGLRQLGFC